jgi:hypothetical protein
VTVPHTAPALSKDDVEPVQVIGGATAAGVKPP